MTGSRLLLIVPAFPVKGTFGKRGATVGFFLTDMLGVKLAVFRQVNRSFDGNAARDRRNLWGGMNVCERFVFYNGLVFFPELFALPWISGTGGTSFFGNLLLWLLSVP